MINRNRDTMRSGRFSLVQLVPSRPSAPPASPIYMEPSTVLLNMDEVHSPLKPKATDMQGHPHRGCNRFGMPSQSAFFCRHNPHTQRVRHIKGIHGKPICWVNDLVLGQQATMCRDRPLTPESCLILRGRIPTSAIGTNSNVLPINTITGLQFFPLKFMDTSTHKLLTDAWIDELRDLTEKVGLLKPSKNSRVTSTCKSPLQETSKEDNNINLQLMLIDILCQILRMKSIGEVQQWLLTSGQREKDDVVYLLCNALDEHQTGVPATDISAQEKLSVKRAPSNHKMTALDEEDIKTCRDSPPLNHESTRCVTSKGQINTKRACSVVTRGRQHTPRPPTDNMRLSSPSVCHLPSPQQPVLRYTKRVVTPQVPAAGSIFQEQWSNYSRQSPDT